MVHLGTFKLRTTVHHNTMKKVKLQAQSGRRHLQHITDQASVQHIERTPTNQKNPNDLVEKRTRQKHFQKINYEWTLRYSRS